MAQPDYKSVLSDFMADIESKQRTDDEIFAAYPEFNNDKRLLDAAYQYANTVKANKYDEKTLESKFPEFFSVEQPTQDALQSGVSGGSLLSEQAELARQDSIQGVTNDPSKPYVKQNEEKKQPNIWQTFYKGLGAGVINTANGLLGFLNRANSAQIANDPMTLQMMAKQGKSQEEIAQAADATRARLDSAETERYEAWKKKADQLASEAKPDGGEKSFTDYINEGKIGKALQLGLGTAAESLPYTASALNPVATAAMIMSMSEQNYRQSIIDNPDMSDGQRIASAVGNAAIEMAVEHIGNPFKVFKAGKLTSPNATKWIKQVVNESKDNIYKGILRVLGFGAKEAGKEGLEEVVTTAGQDLYNTLLDWKDTNGLGLRSQWERAKQNNPDITPGQFARDKADGLANDFIGGALSGMMMSGPSTGAGIVQNAKYYSKNGGSEASRTQAQQQLAVLQQLSDEFGVPQEEVAQAIVDYQAEKPLTPNQQAIINRGEELLTAIQQSEQTASESEQAQRKEIVSPEGITPTEFSDTQIYRQGIEQEVQNFYAERTHDDGNIYPVQMAGDAEKQGFIVGSVSPVLDEIGHIINNDVVTVKWNDGSVTQESAKDLGMLDTEAVTAADFISSEVERRMNAHTASRIENGEEVIMLQRPDGEVQGFFRSSDQSMLEDENGNGVSISELEQSGWQAVRPDGAGGNTLVPISEELGQSPEAAQQQEMSQPEAAQSVEPVVPDINTMNAEELGGSTVEYMGDKASATAFLEAERDKAEAEVRRLSKMKVTRYRDIEDFKQQNDEIQSARSAATNLYNKLQNAIVAVNAYKTLAEQQAEAERKAHAAAIREQRRQLAEAETAGDIEAKWQETKKTVGFTATKTLPNGQKVNGHYILTEAGDVVPSHDPRQNYADSEGYVMENGQNVNDNNYKDPDVQRIAMDMAQNYGGQAVEQMPILENRAGRVLSGNNRTISGIIAAENNTDQAYLAALAENAQQYGFTPEQLAEYQHPRLQFVVEDEFPFTTATFAMFNQQEKKTKSSVNRAVANSKMVTEAVRDKMLEIMDQYDSLDSFFGSENAASDIVQALITEGLMTQQEVAGLTENTDKGFRFGQSGREYVTDMLLGTLFDEQTIKMLAGEKTLKQAILRALPSIVANRRLKGYELTDSINSAIKLLYEARKANEGKSTSDAFQLYLRQVDAFEGRVADRYDGFDIILAGNMSAGVEQLREILGLYNNSAMNEANGQMGFFEPRTIDDIKQDVYEYYTNQQPELAAALDGAAARGAQPESAVPGGVADAQETRQEVEDKIVPERPNSKPLQGMTYNVAEAEDMIGRMVRNILSENGYEDVEIVGTKVIGSRVNGDAREDSDLDAIVEFKGDAREDSLFNLLHEQPIEIDGVTVDINPITEGKSGTIEQFMRRADEYLAEKDAAKAENPQENLQESEKSSTFAPSTAKTWTDQEFSSLILSEEEKIELLNQIDDGQTPIIVVNNATFAQALEKEGASKDEQDRVNWYISKGLQVNGVKFNGKAFINTDSVRTGSEVVKAYVHERQHLLTMQDPSLIQAIIDHAAQEELARVINAISNSDQYNIYLKQGKSGHIALADEFISHIMQEVYALGGEADVIAQIYGIDNPDILNTLNKLDNEQRNDGNLAKARRYALIGTRTQGAGGQDEGNSQPRPGGDLGQQGLRSTGSSNQGTGSRGQVTPFKDTPLGKVVAEIKQKYPGDNVAILFREGDNYEIYDEDAVKAAPVLGLELSDKDGIPFVSFPSGDMRSALTKLIGAGNKIGISRKPSHKPTKGDYQIGDTFTYNGKKATIKDFTFFGTAILDVEGRQVEVSRAQLDDILDYGDYMYHVGDVVTYNGKRAQIVGFASGEPEIEVEGESERRYVSFSDIQRIKKDSSETPSEDRETTEIKATQPKENKVTSQYDDVLTAPIFIPDSKVEENGLVDYNGVQVGDVVLLYASAHWSDKDEHGFALYRKKRLAGEVIEKFNRSGVKLRFEDGKEYETAMLLNQYRIIKKAEQTPSEDRETSETRATETEIGGALVDRLSDIGVGVSTDLDANRAALKAAKADKSDAGAIHYYKTSSGQQYGFSYKGRIYLDPTKIDAELPIHEYGHLWAEAMRRISPESWRSVVDTIKADQASWDFVRELRPELTDENEIADEVIATFSGKRGAERLRAEYKKMHGKDVDYKSKWGNIFQNISKAIQDFWKAVGDFLNIKYQSAEQIYDQVLKDFVDNMNPYQKVRDFLRASDAEYIQAAESGDIQKATNIFYDALRENIGNGITPYMSVGTYLQYKRLAKGVKTRDAAIIREAAEKIAPLIPDNAVLVPTPSHTGRATDMLDLTNAIAEITGSEVADILRSAPRESQYQAKKETGTPMASQQLGIMMEGTVPADKTAIVIDNVVDSGNTAEACIQALGKGVVVTLADSAEQYRHAASLRSAAPILRDKDGNIVPLTKRFNLNGSRYLGRRMYISSNDPRFAISGTQVIPVGEKTLVGLHNISAEKLRKAIKMGGLANPSTAVINIASQNHEQYGDISLVMPSSLVDSKTGRNAGTFTGDIWSPTYPSVERVMDDAGYEKYYDAITKAFGDNEARRPILSRAKLDFDDYLDSGNVRAGLTYWYLLEKGIEPGDVYFNSGIAEDIKKRFEPLSGYFSNLTAEQMEELLSIIAEMRGTTVDQMKQEAQEAKARYQETINDPDEKQFRKNIAQKAIDEIYYYGVQAGLLNNEYHRLNKAVKEDGKIDLTSTLIAAQDIVQTQYQADFDQWLEGLSKRFNIKEVLFDGYNAEGDRIYKPHTLANASRMMNQEPLQNAGGNGGFGATRGQLVERMETLADIRANKERLRPGSEEEFETEEWNKMSDEWFAKILNPLSDMQKISDNPFSNVGYAESRLQEALTKSNPVAYLNKEYGYKIDPNGEWAKNLRDMVQRVKDLPTKYFETKFRRPVYLNEFANAVVPVGLPQDLRDGLTGAGMTLFEYDPAEQGSRRAATLKATADEGIRFSISGNTKTRYADEMESIKNNALNNGTFMQAPNGKPTNLDERQWLQVRLRSFKRLFGDWENDPQNASKVVDENGEPMVVYHRTNNKFTQFDPERARERSGWPTADFGFYFSNVNERGHYGRKSMPVFLNIRNPREIDVDYYADFDYNYKHADPEEMRKGNDGLQINIGRLILDEKATKVFVTPNPNQIKSATDNDGSFSEKNDDIRFAISNQNNDIFYSNAERAVEGIKQEKATPEQWRAMIEKAGGLKAGEDKWIGLSDWLTKQRANIEVQPGDTRRAIADRVQKFTVSKQDILDYIRQNKIQIEETEYGDVTDSGEFKRLEEEFSELCRNIDEVYTQRWVEANNEVEKFYDEMRNKYGDEYLDALSPDEQRTENYLLDAREVYNKENPNEDDAFQEMVRRYGDDFEMAFWHDGARLYSNDNSASAYFADEAHAINDTRLIYTTKGLENKREIALTVPTIESWNESDEIHFGDAGDGRAIAWVRFGDASSSAKTRFIRRQNELSEQYPDAHSLDDLLQQVTDEERAELLRLREEAKTNSREEKILVIDEIQSKRHQEGREKGYKATPTEKEYKEIIRREKVANSLRGDKYDFEREMKVKYGSFDFEDIFKSQMTDAERNEWRQYDHDVDEAEAELHELKDRFPYDPSTPPAAPFEKNWHELAMKRILRFAAENGYDKVAWTTGDQQAARYNIGEVIDSITRNEDKDYPYSYSVMSKDHGELEYDFDENGIYHDDGDPELDGKSMSDVFGKELAKRLQEMPAGETIDNEGLRIGGEGMRGFYDDMLPRFMQKYGKKWGVQVGKVTMENLEPGYQVMHSVDITPEMRESVLQGQPMFSISVNNTENNANNLDIQENLSNFAAKIQENGERLNENGRVHWHEYRPDGGSVSEETAAGMARGADRSDIRVYEPQSDESARAGYFLSLPRTEQRARTEAESERLIALAKENGQFVERKDWKQYGERNPRTSRESVVFRSPDGRQHIKVKDPYALTAIKGNNPEDAIFEHLIHNLLFPDTRYTFKGISEDLGDVRIILSQETVDAVRNATDEEVDKRMRDLGLRKTNPYTYENDIVRITDVTGDNALVDSDGNVRFIDPVIGLKVPARDILDAIDADQPRFAISGDTRFVDIRGNAKSKSEAVTEALIGHANESFRLMQSALKKVNADLRTINAIRTQQFEYDRKVVDMLLNLYNSLLQENSVWAGYMPDTTRRIATQIVHAIGKKDISAEVNTIMDHMVHAQAKAAQRQWDKLRTTPVDKINISGVVMQGKVALQGQHALKAMNEALDSKATIEQLEEQIAQLMDMEDNATDESLKLQYKGQWIGYTIAAQHLERIQHLEEERRSLELELQDARSKKVLKQSARQQLVANIKQAMRDNFIAQAEAYAQSAKDLAEYVTTQEAQAKDFIHRQDANRDMIRSYAQRDLEGLATNPNRNRTRGNIVRQIWDAFASPIRDLQSLLRLTGLHAPDGEGYLYNHFMRGWIDGADQERTGIVAASKTLDDKIAELTHGKYKTWEEAARKINDASHNMFTITMLNGVDGKDMPVEDEIPLNAGNALYIYAVNKMNDGRMKLNGMNITEEDVKALADKVREQFGQEILDVVDWVQSEYFSQLRNRYNPTHEALFGAPIDAIENYFPLRINANARQQNEDLSEPDTDAARLLAGTSTGAIKRRTKNSLPLDVRNADFFQEVIRHITQMERWNAFAQWNRDANILFSDINFRNRIKGMQGTIYGSGDQLYNYMKDAFRVAIGTYKPKTDTFSEITLNVAKGVTSAKINFRMWTAIKQIASFPAFFTYMTDGVFVGSYLRNWMTHHGTMKWARENLPNFEKRVSKRDMGDMRLMQRTTDWQLNKRVLEWSQKYGMAANVYFDTLTCATGARAVYDSRLAEYLKKGYPQEQAERRARQDAEQAFNTSQQSSEGAFMSAVQMDRNLVTAALTVFRTSPIQYTRNFFYHTRNLLRKFGKGSKEEQIAFRTGQYKNDGLTDEQARKAAEKDYNKSIRSDIAGFVVYGALLNILWRLVGQVPYLFFGDDDDKKKQILEDATSGGAWFSPFTGLLGGGIVESALDGNGNVADMFAPELPFTQDVKRVGKYLENDKYAEFANQALSVAMQSGTGFDPQTAADMIQRIVTTIDSEEELDAATKAIQISFVAVASVPQSQYEQMFIDRVVANEGEYDAALEDYIRYQKVHTAPLTWWMRGEENAEKAEENYVKRFNRLLNERDELRNPEDYEE